MKKVSVIISNRNDVAMLIVTIRSCIEDLRPFGKDAEIVVCDNSDPTPYEMVKSATPTGYCREGLLKISHQTYPCLFSAREKAASEASGEYIVCLDSHVLVGRDTIVDLVNFMDRHKDDPLIGFAHAPISWAHHHESRAKHDRDMTHHELGDWHTAYKVEKKITWKGMPWICRRSWFLDRDKGLNGYGALAEHRISWGGGDLHIGVKPWLLGFQNWAVPCNPCIHIGPFPKLDLTASKDVTPSPPASKDGVPSERYRLYSSSGQYPHTFGFLVACYVLGGTPMMERNKGALETRFGKYITVDKWWSKAIQLGESERKWLLSHQKLSFEQLLEQRPWDN